MRDRTTSHRGAHLDRHRRRAGAAEILGIGSPPPRTGRLAGVLPRPGRPQPVQGRWSAATRPAWWPRSATLPAAAWQRCRTHYAANRRSNWPASQPTVDVMPDPHHRLPRPRRAFINAVNGCWQRVGPASATPSWPPSISAKSYNRPTSSIRPPLECLLVRYRQEHGVTKTGASGSSHGPAHAGFKPGLQAFHARARNRGRPKTPRTEPPAARSPPITVVGCSLTRRTGHGVASAAGDRHRSLRTAVTLPAVTEPPQPIPVQRPGAQGPRAHLPRALFGWATTTSG